MKVLVLGNIILPEISRVLSLTSSVSGGWIASLCDGLLAEDSIELAYCFSYKKDIKGMVGRLKYYGYAKKNAAPHYYDESVENKFKDIIQDFEPDIVHIFGTEFPHTLAMTRAFNNPNRTAVNIQGLCSVIARHYTSGLFSQWQNSNILVDIYRWTHVTAQQKRFVIRGRFEIEALQQVGHVIGRTDWDRACALQINPMATYHLCNEILRPSFYNYRWDIDKCQRNSIFISQAAYPVKGLHFMLEALPEIIRRFPKTHLYIAGEDITTVTSWKDRVKIGSYGSHIRRLINRYGLNKYVTFLGMLSEQQMCQQMLRTHILVSPSTIENESNAISEAKILGVPVVASFVGGVTSRIDHCEDGYLYQHDAPYMLANYVCRIFEDDSVAKRFFKTESAKAIETHNKVSIMNNMLDIYNFIVKC